MVQAAAAQYNRRWLDAGRSGRGGVGWVVPAGRQQKPFDMVELILEIVFGTLCAFFGALVGVLYPPKSPSWARAQRLALGLFAAAVLTWIAAYAMTRICTTLTATLVLALTGAVSFVAYLVVGNTCRKYHEDNNTSSTS